MLNGLDLFSGIGGLAKALEDWVTPIAYCENDRYAQGVLLSRMANGELPVAPIWDDVRTLLGSFLKPIDIIYGGFPCQDISVAGNGKGLAGERSGLFFEIMRLAKEIKPKFIFLENVPAIRTRGLSTVLRELTEAGYDCRYGFLSAYDVGASHLRERWFLLAYSNGERIGSDSRAVCREQNQKYKIRWNGSFDCGSNVADTARFGWLEGHKDARGVRTRAFEKKKWIGSSDDDWWEIEPDMGRVAHGVQNRVDRIRCLGNAVVPAQAKEAFERLMGLK